MHNEIFIINQFICVYFMGEILSILYLTYYYYYYY